MQKHNPFVLVILIVLTLGIYGLFWLAETARDLRRRGATKLPPTWWAFAPFLLVIGVALLQFLIRFLLGMPTTGPAPTGASSGLMLTLNVVSLVAGIGAVVAALPAAVYWLFRYCEAADKVSRGKLPTALSFVFLIILSVIGLPFIWPGYMLAGFNRVK